jgi:hypothetical protein
MRIYELNDFQLNMKEYIKKIPSKHLHYITGQQSNLYSNLTLKELKKFIQRGIRQYIQDIEPNYSKDKINELVKFYCIFETKKSFNLSLHNVNIMNDDFNMGLHFHLFISSPNQYNWISFELLTFYIFNSLTSLKHKSKCISQYGSFKIDILEDNFINYHTKQFDKYPSSEMIFTNL